MTVLFFTLEAADSVIHDLLIAVFLVAFVMLFFLHSIRNLIVMVSIPSLISTFIGFYYLGYTLNLMSLLGLSWWWVFLLMMPLWY
jgi:HAE1 family hydrophobic/amphiphilic exporter-1